MTVTAEVQVDMREPEVLIRFMLTITRAIDDYLGDLARRRYSKRTLTTYRRELEGLADMLPVDTDVAQIKVDDIRRYLRRKEGLAVGTIALAESVLSGFFKWLSVERRIGMNPMERLPRTRRIPAENLDVTTVSTDDVRRLIAHAETWAEKLAIGVLVYLGPRRHAAALLRVSDYDRARGRIKFREKGDKTIWKPVPDELDQLLEAALAAGVYETNSYLIPPEGVLVRAERDDRVIWRLVKKVAARAGIEAHTHSLRAAFAVFYLENNPGDIEALKELLGHESISTTQVYLRKLDRGVAMERVRGLSWGVALSEGERPAGALVEDLMRTGDER